MDPDLLVAMLIGCAASIGLNLGKGVQKLKVHVLKPLREFLSRPKRRDSLIWLVGVAMTAIAGLLFVAATNLTDKPSLVSSLNGVGLVALAFFSSFVLAERVGFREWGAIGLIVLGTGIVQYFDVPSDEPQRFSAPALWISLGVCLAAFVALVALAQTTKRGRAHVFAGISGTCLGLMVIFFDLASVASGGSMLGTFRTPYLYIGFVFGNAAFVFTNAAFFFGSATIVVPTVNSFMIVMPSLLETFVFGVVLQPVQYAGFAVLVLGVVVLTTAKGHIVGQEQAEDPPAPPADEPDKDV